MSDKNQVTVRIAKPEDVHYIRSLSRRVFQQYGPYDETLADWFEAGFTLTFLALMEGRPVGFAMLSGVKGLWFLLRISELLAIAVEPEKWKLGIGERLMKEVHKRAEELEVEMLVLHTAVENVPGQKLFKKYGFVPLDIKKNFYPEGQDALMMYKDM